MASPGTNERGSPRIYFFNEKGFVTSEKRFWGIFYKAGAVLDAVSMRDPNETVFFPYLQETEVRQRSCENTATH